MFDINIPGLFYIYVSGQKILEGIERKVMVPNKLMDGTWPTVGFSRIPSIIIIRKQKVAGWNEMVLLQKICIYIAKASSCTLRKINMRILKL